ncbi:MAG: 50S ribosomal protein L10 [Bacteroidetes bacterium]|nr:MAG: 50S ribosomal protein L10 [Bacteroidota bacterium]
MTRTEKQHTVEVLKEKFSNSEYFYVTDASTLTVEEINKLRAMLFEKGIEMRVVKNTLARKAMEALPEDRNYGELFDALKGPTAILFSTVANAPAKVIKEYRGDNERPILKAAYIDTAVYLGDDQLKMLADLKGKDELLGDILGLLMAPISNVMGALNSGGNTLTGLLKALEEREG